MKIVTSHFGMTKDTTLDSLLDATVVHDMFQFTIRKQEHRDFFEGYCLVRGIDFPLEDWNPVSGGMNHVEITFPELELHCDSTGDSP